jgi:hypothetical protein
VDIHSHSNHIYAALPGELSTTDTQWKDTLALVRIFRPWRRAYFLKEDINKYTIHSYLSAKEIRTAFFEPAYQVGWFAPYSTPSCNRSMTCSTSPSTRQCAMSPWPTRSRSIMRRSMRSSSFIFDRSGTFLSWTIRQLRWSREIPSMTQSGRYFLGLLNSTSYTTLSLRTNLKRQSARFLTTIIELV